MGAREVNVLRLRALGVWGTICAIAERHGFTVQEVFDSTRRPENVRARDHVFHVLNASGRSASELGRLFGLHHTSILAACNRHGARLVPETLA